VVRRVKVPLGTFACNGIEACLDSDVATGVRAALSDFTQRLASGTPPVDVPRAPLEADPDEPAIAVDLSLDERSWQLLRHEARRQGTTVTRLSAHAVLVYLADLDRLTPPAGGSLA
jgi:hypothetical protein